MIFNNSVTVYHDLNGDFMREFFVRAMVSNEENVATGKGSMREQDTATIRIFTHDTPEIRTGDRIFIGYSESMIPPEDSMVILSVTKNHRGSGRTRHYKITAT